MPGVPNPRISWAEIRRQWEAGTSLSQLAREYSVTRQGIMYRRDREGWERMDLADPVVLKHAPSLAGLRYNTPARSAESAAYILEMIEQGVSDVRAARALGMDDKVFLRWRDNDKDFARQLRQAAARFEIAQVGKIQKAGDRGDWRAASYLLERNPETRDQFAQAGVEGKGGGLTVVVNVPPPDQPLAIDVTPISVSAA